MSEMVSLKAVPTGVRDFKKLRDEDFYYVDKTELISDILSNKSEVFLFTRPRRFGKSLNISMLDAFFNMKYKGNTWFDGLKISEHDEVSEYKNAYPVINLCMKDVSVKNYGNFISKIKSIVRRAYRQFPDLKKCDETSELVRKYYDESYSYDEVELQESIMILCEMITIAYGVKPIVLIDEYDAPINNSFNKKDHEEILDFLRYFYSSTLKDNDFISFAVVTGVMQIAKESIFSGLNNLKVNNILSKAFDERYGFTPKEVEEMCAYYGHPEKFVEAKDWYDGYRFGNAEIYNPWSVLNYIDAGFDADKYWTGTSGNDIIDTLLNYADSETYEELQSLGEGKTTCIRFPTSIVLNDLNRDKNTIYAVMAIAGYLNAVPNGEGSYDLSVPNKEMYFVFDEVITTRLQSFTSGAFSDFLEGMQIADVQKVKKGLNNLFKNDIPSIILTREKDYQLILAAMAMNRCGRYEIRLEKEAGIGRADIIMKPTHPGLPNIIFELKKTADKRKKLQKLADAAIDQIMDKEYYWGMDGRVLMYGIAFRGKESEVSFKEMRLHKE